MRKARCQSAPHLGRQSTTSASVGGPSGVQIEDRVKTFVFADDDERSLRLGGVARKAQANVEARLNREREYWQWARKVKQETPPNFKLPKDSYIGTEPVEDKIKRQIRAAREKMAEVSAQYEAWLEKISQEQAERIKEQLREKFAADREYANAAQAAAKKRAAHVRALKRRSADVAADYYGWLEETKKDIARRPQSAPPARKSSAKTVEAFLEEKLAAYAKETAAMQRDYDKWLKSIQKASFTLPHSHCLTVKERDLLIAEKASKGNRALAQVTVEYKKWLIDLEQRHHERIMETLKAKFQADKEFNEERALFQAHLEEKAAEASFQREQLAMEHEQFLTTMKARTKAKPLMLEEYYVPACWSKQAPHRRSQKLARARSRVATSKIVT